MRVTVYDKNPGVGIVQWGLKVSWFLGCWIQKLFGAVDKYYGASSWEDALAWLSVQGAPLKSIQYWGHGSPGTIWLAQMAMPVDKFIETVKPKVVPDSIIWWRVCSAFQGLKGQGFSKRLANELDCTIAGHTRTIGPMQGGLHTRKPNTEPSWPVTDGELPSTILTMLGIDTGNNTILCTTTKVPEGW